MSAMETKQLPSPVLNADAYVGGYETLRYPMGDVPRERGVCTDVIVRALRNAGIDLQAALHQDIARSRRSYPMVPTRSPASSSAVCPSRPCCRR